MYHGVKSQDYVLLCKPRWKRKNRMVINSDHRWLYSQSPCIHFILAIYIYLRPLNLIIPCLTIVFIFRYKCTKRIITAQAEIKAKATFFYSAALTHFFDSCLNLAAWNQPAERTCRFAMHQNYLWFRSQVIWIPHGIIPGCNWNVTAAHAE